jgi:5-hydroxyisourate hydrolase-like protein (transthyretin family)
MVKGRITDVTGAPFRSTRVELRRLKGKKDFEVLSRVTTDRDGNFDLGLLKKGKYRLLASQDRSFKQPDDLVCSEKKGCFLAITLRVNPTDMPESTCPIR